MDKYPLFSNGTEFMLWNADNCYLCAKASNYNEKTDTYTKYRCAIQRDIDIAYINDGMGSKRVHDAVSLARCPYFKDKKNRSRQVKKHRNIHGQQELPFEVVKGGEK
jgi:hypothetical protein